MLPHYKSKGLVVILSKIRQLRLQSGLSQQTVASTLGISTRALRYIEAGERLPSLTVANKLEDIFGVSQRALFGFDFTRSSEKKEQPVPALDEEYSIKSHRTLAMR